MLNCVFQSKEIHCCCCTPLPFERQELKSQYGGKSLHWTKWSKLLFGRALCQNHLFPCRGVGNADSLFISFYIVFHCPQKYSFLAWMANYLRGEMLSMLIASYTPDGLWRAIDTLSIFRCRFTLGFWSGWVYAMVHRVYAMVYNVKLGWVPGGCKYLQCQ